MMSTFLLPYLLACGAAAAEGMRSSEEWKRGKVSQEEMKGCRGTGLHDKVALRRKKAEKPA